MIHGPFSSVVNYACIHRIIVGIDAVEGGANGSRNKI